MNASETEEMGELCHIQMCSCSQFSVQLSNKYIGRVCLYSSKLVWISDKSQQHHAIHQLIRSTFSTKETAEWEGMQLGKIPSLLERKQAIFTLPCGHSTHTKLQ